MPDARRDAGIDGPLKERRELFDSFVEAHVRTPDDVRPVPVALERQTILVPPVPQDRSGPQEADTFEPRAIADELLEARELGDRGSIDRRVDAGRRQKRGELGTECDAAGGVRDEVRIEAVPIVDDCQLAGSIVPDGDDEHAVQRREACGAALQVQRQRERPIVRALDEGAGSRQPRPAFGLMVELAAQHQPDASIGALNRLGVTIEDPGAHMTEHDARRRRRDGRLVMRQMDQPPRHPCADRSGVTGAAAVAEDAAHERLSPGDGLLRGRNGCHRRIRHRRDGRHCRREPTSGPRSSRRSSRR